MNSLIKVTRFSGVKYGVLGFTRLLSTQNFTKTPLPLPPPPLLAQSVSNVDNSWIWQQNNHIKLPVVNINKIEVPNSFRWKPVLIDLPLSDKVIEAPSKEDSDIPKHAVRMIVIRRKKMKKHKLRKLRKRMKFEWAKLRQRREWNKEKIFQAGLIEQCKAAEAFSAEKYVQERIDKLNEIIIPRRWKGKKLPEYLIREKMGLPPKNK